MASGPVARYRVTAEPGGATATVDAPLTSATVGNLDNRTSYNFIVVAINASNEEGPGAASGSQPSLKTIADWHMTGRMSDFVAAKEQRPLPFDWDDDSCAGNAPDLFAANPCKRHDFGYRNYGKGLQLQRDEDTRAWIDQILYEDILDECAKPQFAPVASYCRTQALVTYLAVRGNPTENWNQPP